MPSPWPTTSAGGTALTLALALALGVGVACRRSVQEAAPDAGGADVRDDPNPAAAIASDQGVPGQGDDGADRHPSSRPAGPAPVLERVLGGRVVDGRGQPVSGAQVRAVSADGAFWLGGGELGVVPGPVPPIPRADSASSTGTARGVGWSRRTDANGRFVLFGLPAADVRLVIDHPLLRPAQSGLISLGPAEAAKKPPVEFNGRWLAVCPTLSAGERQGRRGARSVGKARCPAPDVAPGAAIVGDMTVRHGGVVRGQVLDEHGKALAQALITARDAGLTRLAYSDSQGSFTVAGLLARSEITADLDGHASATAIVQAAAGATAAVTLTLRALPEATNGTTAPTVSIVGHVQEWRTGAPVKRFSVRIDRAISPIRVADGRGRFRVRAARGRRSLHFSAAGFAALTVPVDVPEPTKARAMPDLRVELRRAGSVRGRAFDGNGQPIAGARVSCAGLTVSSDARGRFELRGVPVGVHEVHLLADDGQIVRSDMVSVHADGRPTVVRFDVNR